MARRKRASMREGPLADLFRSTIREEEGQEQPTQQQPSPPEESPSDDATRVLDPSDAEVAPSAPPEPPRVREEPEPEPAPPDPERVHAYRVDDLRQPPAVKERLSRIFAEDHDVEGPAYGREDPGLS